MGDAVAEDELGSILTKLYVVGVPLLPLTLALVGLRSWVLPCESDALRFVPTLADFCGSLFFPSVSLSVLWTAFLDLAMGSAKPRNFPRLATPTPHVNWVL